MSIFTKIFIGLSVIAVIACLLLSSMLIETNDAGFVQVKQAAGSGTMTVRTTPGVYSQMFADIHTYKISDVYDFNSPSDVISVRFNDASTAQISGQIKYRLPVGEEKILQLHQDFRSYDAVQHDLIRQVVAAAIKQTSTLFGAEEVYSTRRSDFISLINEQIKNGIYATNYTETYKKDEDGNTSLVRLVAVRRDERGFPVISENSTFKRYGVELVQLVINDITFDDKTNELIAKRKEADQEKVVAKAKAERAKQDAITAEAQGKANVAIAEAEALVVKKKAVIEAEKETEVAHQQAMQAEEVKKATISKGQAEAEAARLKVAAGLTPQEKAQYDMDTAIGVARAVSSINLPRLMVIGGGQGGNQVNPFDAVGLESLIRISKNMASEKTAKSTFIPEDK